VWDLVAPSLRKTTLLLWVIWFVNTFVYYGLVLFAPAFFKAERGDPDTDDKDNSVYLDILLTSAAELPGLLIAALCVEKLGRRSTQTAMFLGCSISIALMLVNSGGVTSLIFSICARMFITGTFSTVYVYTPEVYPTTIRTTGLGVASSIARIAGIITPFIANVLSKNDLYIPVIIYSGSSLLACIASMFLPFETRKLALPDLMKEEKTETTALLDSDKPGTLL